MSRTLSCAVAVVLAGVAGWWLAHDDAQPVAGTPAQTPAVTSSPSPAIDRTDAALQAAAAPPPSVVEAHSSLTRYATGKYAFLFENMFVNTASSDELRTALLERERIAVVLNTARQSREEDAAQDIARHEAALAHADQRVRTLLHPTDYAIYEALKDSDIEQYQLGQYADGISQVAPLSDEERRAILLTKLNYKRQFRQMLLDSGLLRPELSDSQRQQAFEGVRSALEQYRDSYLAEVRQYLYDDEQYALLRNYESSEFAAEMDKLRSIAGGG